MTGSGGKSAKRNNPFAIGLKHKLVALITALIIAAQLATGLVIVSRVEKAMERENYLRGLTIASDLARSSVRPLISRDLDGLRVNVRVTKAHEDVIHAMVLDPVGRIVMHNNLARVGNDYDGPARAGAALNEEGCGPHYPIKDGVGVDIRVPVMVGGRELGSVVVGFSHAGIQRQLGRLKKQIALVLLVSIGIGIVLAGLVSELVTRPLVRLQQAAKGLEAGHFDVGYLNTSASDELGGLARAFSSMADRLRFQVCYDALTGIYNRFFFQKRLKELWAESVRYHKQLPLLMIDVDHFKRINDTHGHEVGDRCLMMLAEVLLEQSRAEDCVARYGGEEFVVLMAESDSVAAFNLAERIRATVESRPVALDDGRTVAMTISVGVAVFPEDATTKEELISRADQALYRAKRAGRNRVSPVEE